MKRIIIGLIILTVAVGLWATRPENDPILTKIQIDHSKDLDVQKAYSSGGLQPLN